MFWEEYFSFEFYGCEGDVYFVIGLFRVVGFGVVLLRVKCMGFRVFIMIYKYLYFFWRYVVCMGVIVCIFEFEDINFGVYSFLE